MEKLRFGMSTCGIIDLDEKAFETYAAAGVSELELAYFYLDSKEIDWNGLKKRAEMAGIGLWSYHLPFSPIGEIDIAHPDNEKRVSVVRGLSEIIKHAGDIGIDKMVIHPSAEPYDGEERGDVIKRAQESLVFLADAAEGCGAVIAVENLPRMCLGRTSEELKKLISVDSRLRVCFDTNHVLAQPIDEFILDIGDKIITTHFSDCDFKNERHWLPGEGKINWNIIFEALHKINYNGPLLYELDFKAYSTIDRRLLTCEDFKNNYHCLVNNLPLQAIGTPIEENCTTWEEAAKKQ